MSAEEATTIPVHSITRLTNVVVTIEAAESETTIVVTRVPSGDQTRIVLDPAYADRLRASWVAASNGGKKTTRKRAKR